MNGDMKNPNNKQQKEDKHFLMLLIGPYLLLKNLTASIDPYIPITKKYTTNR